MQLIFDMDGPLCVSRQTIGDRMFGLLELASKSHSLVLVTGSTRGQAGGQLGAALSLFDVTYFESGNDGHRPVTNVEGITSISSAFSRLSSWTGEQSGPQLDIRRGVLNLAACGQNASPALRQMYSEWEIRRGERYRIAEELSEMYPICQFLIGGRVSIDVCVAGKEQIPDVRPDSMFFCDSLGRRGADTLLASRVGAAVYCPHPTHTARALELILDRRPPS